MTDWKSIGRKLAGAGLPIIGAQLGGPVGAAVGRDIAARIGVEPDPEIVAQALGDPETMLELRRMEIDAAAAERTDALRAQEIAAKDVQAAREAHKGDRWPLLLDATVVLMVGGLIAALVFAPIPDANQRAFDIVLGAVLGAFTTVMSYWRGSSRGSAIKQQTLDSVVERR